MARRQTTKMDSRWRRCAIHCGALLFALLGALVRTSDAAVPDPAAEQPTLAGQPQMMLPNFAALVRRDGPAVVNISVTREVTQLGIQLPPGIEPGNPLAPYLARRVLGNREEVSLGSGFIVSEDGYILTNRHVVGDANRVQVKLLDKREFEGKVIGSDALSDVALVKIDATDLPVVSTGNPDRVSVGDWVMAIGAPYGFANTVTAGIVSAKSRALPGEAYIPFLQTDVPINPGNSGGPLFDLSGHVIGINSMIYTKTGGYQGLSFAVPINIALDVKEQLLKSGHVSRGRLGIAVQEVSQSLARSFGLAKPTGALISTVEPNGPGAQAGLQPGDVILAIDNVTLDDSADFFTTVAKIRPGTTVELHVWRSASDLVLSATVGELASPERAGTSVDAASNLGITVREMTLDELKRLQVDHGLVVQQVTGRAATSGLKPGDIVLSVNGTPIASAQQLAARLRESGSGAALLIQRGGQRLYLPMQISGRD
ncbi:MAG TPA: Do family serine endopeptidase [Pararobbsia sp.]|nr:Do family serine endopeptidase [Pararobbsia sp.]